MAKISFKFRSKKDISHLTLRLMHTYHNKENIDFFVNSTYIINKKYWNIKKNEIKGSDSTSKNHKVDLLNLEHHILESFAIANNQGIQITKEWIQFEIEKHFGRVNQPQHMSFLQYYEWYITNYSKMPLPTSGKPLAKSSVKTYKSHFKLIKRFNDEIYPLSYEKITIDFYEDYLNFLCDLEKSTNYIGSQIKTLKTIMNTSFELNYHSNTDYKKRAFKKPTEEVFNIALSEHELNSMFHLNFTTFKSKKLKNGLTLTSKTLLSARDLFLIGANTGLRVSDFNKLTKSNFIIIENKNYIKVKTKKTNQSVTIPINPIVQSILNRYNDSELPRLADQTINYALKEIGKLANINEKITKTTSEGHLKVSKELFKHEMITNHTARRSFCTNAYKSKMPTIDIMAISGHKTEKVFLNYIKVSEEERAIKIGSNDFFNKSAPLKMV